MEFNTLFQLLSLAQQRPKVLGNAKSMLFIPDLLNYFLTGVKKTEYTIASTSQILNPSTRDWDMELARTMGIPSELLGEIVQPGGEVGPLLKQITDEIGDISVKVVNAASHDTASAVVAVPSDTEDFVYISSGTWSLMGLEVNEPIVNSESYKFNVTNEGGAYGKIRVLKNIMGLWILQESRRQWEREGTKHSFNELEKMALEVKPCAYLINPDSPEFARPGNLPQKIREYCKASGQAVPQSKGEIVRCIYDSLALKYRQVVEALDSMKGSRTKQINIVGGGTKDTLLCQLAANACGREVLAGPVEATAIGNITVQLIGQGLIKDLSQARKIIRDSFDVIHYTPASDTDWDKAYEFFVTLK
jgi:sugar (pentulose or hexulose) kinase